MTWTRTPEDKRRHKTQKARILEFLRTGQALTQDKGRELFGAMRVASRITELKKEGHIILSLRNGANCATYLMLEGVRDE